MHREKHFNIISSLYIVFLFILYLLVLIYIVFNIDKSSYTYIIAIVLSLFFGTPMKSVYDIIFNLYFNFSEDIAEHYKIYRRVMHAAINIISIALTIILISILTSSVFIYLAIATFLLCVISLCTYAGIIYQKEEKKGEYYDWKKGYTNI